MNIGLIIYGSLETLSGGYLYDRKLVEFLRSQGDTVEIISLPPGMTGRPDWRNYTSHLGDNFTFRLPPGLDILIQDELNHPSLIGANAYPQPYPIISLVHHLRCSELRPGWQNALYRVVEKYYLQSVDGFIFNSQTTKGVVNGLIGGEKPSIVAFPPADHFGQGLTEQVVAERAKSGPLRIVFLGNVIERKGLHTLLGAIFLSQPHTKTWGKRTQCLWKETPLFHLDVVGSLVTDPFYAAEMQRRASVFPLSPFVQFHSSLDDASLVELLSSAHLLAVPSSYEGFGIVYLEGMAFGLPAIGTTAGAAGEIISDGETGYLIAPDNAEMLAARLTTLASDRDLLAQMSLNALKRYQLQPVWVQTARSIREFLRMRIKSGK